MQRIVSNPDDFNGYWPYAIETDGRITHWMKPYGVIAGSGEQTYQAYKVSNLRNPSRLMKASYWVMRDTYMYGIDQYCRPVPYAEIQREPDAPAVVMTKDGPQALLEGFTPPPVRKGDADQLTMF